MEEDKSLKTQVVQYLAVPMGVHTAAHQQPQLRGGDRGTGWDLVQRERRGGAAVTWGAGSAPKPQEWGDEEGWGERGICSSVGEALHDPHQEPVDVAL